MDKEKLELFKQDFSLMIEAGFVAVKQLDETSANRIFHAAHVVSPKSTAPSVGLGYIALNKLEIKLATMIFEEVVKFEPDNWLAVTFLGMCHVLAKSKRKKGLKLIEEAMKKSDDPTIQNLGKLCLEWVDKDLTKSKSPLYLALQNELEEGEEDE